MIRNVCIFLLLVSCTPRIDEIEIDGEPIESTKMVRILKEIVQTEAHVQNRYGQVSTFYQVMIQTGDSILGAHGVSRDQFESSMNYYAARKDEMNEIYEEIIDLLSEEQGKLESEMKKVDTLLSSP